MKMLQPIPLPTGTKWDALRVDRLGRSVLDIASLVDVAQKQGVAICTVENSLDSSSPSGRW